MDKEEKQAIRKQLLQAKEAKDDNILGEQLLRLLGRQPIQW